MKNENFDEKVAFVNPFNQSHGARCTQFAEPLNKMTWLYLLLIWKRRDGETPWTAYRIPDRQINGCKQKTNTSQRVSVFAAEGQVDDLLSQRVHPSHTWMSYWSVAFIDRHKPFFFFWRFERCSTLRVALRPTFFILPGMTHWVEFKRQL